MPPSSANTTGSGVTLYGKRYRGWLLFLLVAAQSCAFVDRIIVAVVGPGITAELKLSDLEFGLLGGMAFAIFYSALGLPIARLAERGNRVNIISVSVALWSALTAVCGLAGAYWHLLVLRMGVGVGEAGCVPPSHSLISDHYPAAKRASALSIFSLGIPIGLLIGSVAGGWLAREYGWRWAFVVLGLPGLLIAALVRFTLVEPMRGHSDGEAAGAETPPIGVALRTLAGKRTFLHLCAGVSLATMAANGINLFTPSFLARTFRMDMAEAGLLFGLVVGLSGAAGMLLGGFGADLAAKRSARWYTVLPAAGLIVAAPLYIAAFSSASPIGVMSLLIGGVICMSIYFAPSFAVLQNLAEPRMRASASAIVLLLMNLIGQGIGPLVIGWLSDTLAGRSFEGGIYREVCFEAIVPDGLVGACENAAATGLQGSIVAIALVFVWASAHFVFATGSISREIARP